MPYTYGWRGIDTNFVYRMRGGIRINGGTSTGKSFRDLCDFEINQPIVSASAKDGHGRRRAAVAAVADQRPRIGHLHHSVGRTSWRASSFQSRPGVETVGDNHLYVSDT